MLVQLLCFTLLSITISYLDVEEDGFHLTASTEEMFSSLQSLRKTVERYITEMMEVEKTNLLLGKPGDIKFDLLKETSANFTIHPFGSRVMGLGLRTSDCDLFVDVGQCYKGGGHTMTKDECLNSVQLISNLLYSHNKSFYDIKLVPKAKVPLLKVVHRDTGIQVDISTRNGLGVENSKLIRGYFADQRVKFVSAAIKMWARGQRLAKSVVGPGAFSSYGMLWLTLFALKQDDPPAVTPTVHLKREYTGPELVIDGWDCGHTRSIHPKSKNNKSEIELLQHFFNFYSRMSLREIKENVFCPYTGNLIPRKQFANVSALPNEFENYKRQVRMDRSSFFMVCNTSLCIQDPVEQSNNIAKAVEDWAILRFLRSCQLTANAMKKIIHPELDYASSVGGLK